MWAYCGAPDPQLANFTGLFIMPSLGFIESAHEPATEPLTRGRFVYGATSSINLSSFASVTVNASPRRTSYDTFGSALATRAFVFPGFCGPGRKSHSPAHTEEYTVEEASKRAAQVALSAANDEHVSHAQDIRQFLYKGSKLKNTPFVYGLVAYTGKCVHVAQCGDRSLALAATRSCC